MKTRKTPATPADFVGWLTKQEAANAIGVSTKTVEKLAADGRLHQGKRAQLGRPPAAVYHPDDVETLRRERNPGGAPFLLPRLAETSQKLSPTSQMSTVEAFIESFRTFISHSTQTSSNGSVPVRIPERVFLSLTEASAYSGLPRTHLRVLMRDGKLAAIRTGRGWRIRRIDLESL
jgi:excisionase family DNA binding protein